MPRISKVPFGAASHVAMLLEQIEKRYTAGTYSPNMAAAFVLYLIKRANLIDVEDLPGFLKEQQIDRQLIPWIKMQIDDHWNDFRRLIAMLQPEGLREYILTHQPMPPREVEVGMGTPECLCDLAIAIMKRHGVSRVCNPCCGIGNFMVRLSANEVKGSFAGYDISDRCVCITKIRAHVLGNHAEIRNENTLECETRSLGTQDGIFLDPSLGMRLSHISNVFNTREGAVPVAFPMLKGTNSTEWVWAAKMLDALDDDGIIVVLMTNGALFNMTEAPLRQYLVDRGLVRYVVALPERLLNYTALNLSLVVLSKQPCSSVTMVDATSLCERGVRVNLLTPHHIAAMVDALEGASTIRMEVSRGDIAENGYQLAVQRYFMPTLNIRNGKPLKELCMDIFRGPQRSREELQKKRMDGDSDVRCLTIANIQDGLVDKELPFIDTMSVREERYCLMDGDVVITKAMAPCKVAVVEVERGVSILPSGNFFVLRPNRNLVDPYYLTAYLRSESGKMQLERMATGTTIRTIAQECLEKMLIPMAPLASQMKFAKEYREKLLHLSDIRKECELTKKALDNAYDEFERASLA